MPIKNGKKIIEVSVDAMGRISGTLRNKLKEEHGVEVVVIEEEKVPTIADLAETMTLELVDRAVKLEEVFDDNWNSKVNHRAPKKIGQPCKAKLKNIRGKRYGR